MVIKYNTARLAKERGFNVPTFGYYIKLHTGWELQFEDQELGAYNWNDRKGISAPEQYNLEEWLFRNHNIFIIIKYVKLDSDVQKGFYYSKTYKVNDTLYLSSKQGKDLFSGFESYEECLEAALQWTLLCMK
jgi:hypothetical protein